MALFTSRLPCIYRGTLISRLIFLKSAGSQVPCQASLAAGANVTKVNGLSRSSCYSNFIPSTGSTSLRPPINFITAGVLISIRNKSSKKIRKSSKYKGKQDESDDDEDSDDNDVLESSADFRDVKVRLPSLRMDAVLKAGLNLSRNKVEAAFYGSKIRINGEKSLKKSSQLQEGDEVDVLLEEPASSPQFVYVSRVVIMRAGQYDQEKENVTANLRRYRKLLVEKPSDQPIVNDDD